jgi:hypothetical protein
VTDWCLTHPWLTFCMLVLIVLIADDLLGRNI